jgi:hypothetical protein
MTFCTRVRTFGLLGVTAASLAACSASQPPHELLDARAAYIKAASGPAAQLRPDTLIDAHNALNSAERAFASQADDIDVNTISYVSASRSLPSGRHVRTQQAMAEAEFLRVSTGPVGPRPGRRRGDGAKRSES